MAMEMHAGAVVVTGEHTELFRLMQLASALGLEINTGMKFSHGSVMNVAREQIGSSKRTKKGVLADLVKYAEANFPEYRPAPSVVKALGK